MTLLLSIVLIVSAVAVVVIQVRDIRLPLVARIGWAVAVCLVVGGAVVSGEPLDGSVIIPSVAGMAAVALVMSDRRQRRAAKRTREDV